MRDPDRFNLGGSNRLMTTSDAAAYLAVPPESLRKYRDAWGIPWIKVGRGAKYRERDLNAYIERKFAEAAS